MKILKLYGKCYGISQLFGNWFEFFFSENPSVFYKNITQPSKTNFAATPKGLLLMSYVRKVL